MPPTRPERWPAEDLNQPRKPDKKWAAAVASLFLVFAAFAAYDVMANRAALTAKSVAAPSRPHAHHVRARPSSAVTPPATATAPATRSASPSPSTSPSAPAVTLSAQSVAAFGPDGTSDGDNAGLASRVLAGNGVNAWSSLWYATPEFGDLQAGTGLLLDMGSTVSVSRVRVVLGDSAGADVEVRLGDAADPASLSTAASASDVGGTVRLSPSSPRRARYVLIWFTRLPSDSAGTYQVLVYSVTVSGRR
jgi:hypothetical protein